MAAQLHILILAAGASSRMAPRDKLLETVGGQPLLARITRMAVETGAAVTVALPPDRPLRNAAIAGLPVARVIVETAKDGMAESLKAGLATISAGRDVMMLLADLPEITQADLQRMVAAHQANPGKILRATSQDGKPGHPVIFPSALRGELMALQGDAGARALLRDRADSITFVALPNDHATTDLDTPEQWESWRKSND